MKIALSILAAVLALGIAAKGFAMLIGRPRSSAKNNWKNEDFMAREEGGSWVESQHSVSGANAAPPSII